MIKRIMYVRQQKTVKNEKEWISETPEAREESKIINKNNTEYRIRNTEYRGERDSTIFKDYFKKNDLVKN